MRNEKRTSTHKRQRRQTNLLRRRGATALVTLVPHPADTEPAFDEGGSAQPELIMGNGEWTYKVSAGWGRLPAGTVFGGTHGGIATDKARAEVHEVSLLEAHL